MASSPDLYLDLLLTRILQTSRTHGKAECKGEFCSLHNPSDHHMKGWKTLVRRDRNCMTERICTHGIGHPDPDSLAWMERVGIDDDGTHGCDGCCWKETG